MPWTLGKLTEELVKLRDAVPLTFKWYTGRTQPPVEQTQIAFWEDINNEIAKILMRRGSKTYVFTSYQQNTGTNITITIDQHAHRHATGGSTKADVGADPIGPYTFSWTREHTWNPSTNAIPISINKTSSLTSASLFKVFDTDATSLLDLSNVGLLGINGTPDAFLTIFQGGLSAPVTSGLVAWYYADSITTLSDGQDVVTWADSSGNGNNLTAAGITAAGGATAVRPKWNAAGTTKAITALPSVSFEGSIAGSSPLGYFTIATGTIPLTAAAGWTIATIWRDYSSFVQSNYLLGVTYTDLNDNFIRITGNGGQQANTEEGASTKYFSDSYPPGVHVDGNDIEGIVYRCASSANGNILRTWVDGTLIASTNNAGGPFTRTSDVFFRYLGTYGTGGAPGSWAGCYGKALVEMLIWNRQLSDAEVATVNTYLANRISGATTTGTYDLIRLKSSAGAILSRFDENAYLGIGLDPSYPLDVTTAVATQVRFGYDTSNYYTTAVSSTGGVTLDAVGTGASFRLNDRLGIGAAPASGTMLDITADADATVGIVVRPHSATQTGDLQQWMDKTNTSKKSFIARDGYLSVTKEATGGYEGSGPFAGEGSFFAIDTGGSGVGLWFYNEFNAVQLTDGVKLAINTGADYVWSGNTTFGAGGTVTVDSIYLDFEDSSAQSGLSSGMDNDAAKIAFHFDDLQSRNSGYRWRLTRALSTSGTAITFAGTVNTSNGSTTVNAATGSFFTQNLEPGMQINIGTMTRIISVVNTATSLTVTVAANVTYTGVAMTYFEKAKLLGECTWDGHWGFGYVDYPNTIAQDGHILAFIAQDSANPVTRPVAVGILSSVAHNSASTTQSKMYGLVGSVYIGTATGYSGVVSAGVVGTTASQTSSAMTGYNISGVSAGFCSINSLTQMEPSAKDFDLTIKGLTFSGGYDHAAAIWVFGHGLNVTGGYPVAARRPTIMSGLRIPIPDWGGDLTAPAGNKLWAIYGDHYNSSQDHFPSETGFIRMIYPRRTTNAATRATHSWWEPFPMPVATRANAAAGDVYFEQGTNYAAGLWQCDNDGWVKVLGDDLVFIDDEIVSYQDETVEYH